MDSEECVTHTFDVTLRDGERGRLTYYGQPQEWIDIFRGIMLRDGYKLGEVVLGMAPKKRPPEWLLYVDIPPPEPAAKETP